MALYLHTVGKIYLADVHCEIHKKTKKNVLEG